MFGGFIVMKIFTAQFMKQITNSLSILLIAGSLLACKHNDNIETSPPVITDYHKVTISDNIRAYLESNEQAKLICTGNMFCNNKNLAKIYESLGYNAVWVDNNSNIKPEAESVINILQSSYKDGLNTSTYHTKELNDLLGKIRALPKTQNEVVEPQLYVNFDITLSDAYISYARDMQNGRINPVSTYPDWKVDRILVDVTSQFESSVSNGDLLINMQNLIPKNNMYSSLKAKLSEYNQMINESGYGVLSDQEKETMRLIALNMDRLRWLPHSLPESYIMVNIPRFELDIFVENGESVVLSMPVIVGRDGENKTCLVSSNITSVEFNPYWGIPKRIATKEYLVKLKANPEYLNDKNIRIYGKGNKEVDATSIDWESINEKNFNYFFRQDPGTKNALGKVKFTFPNSCGIYMHDTSNRGLFGKNARSMSHGCVRIGKPIQLANYLLISRDNNSESKINKMLASDEHAGIKVKQPMPLFITYQTLIVSESGALIRYKDIYNIDNIKFVVFGAR